MSHSVSAGRLAAKLAELGGAERLQGLPAVLCIGTDRSTGDAFGPLTGTFLREAGYPHVIGTLDHPCDSGNLPERLAELPAGRAVLAVDCCLGADPGRYRVSPHPLAPGKSMGKPLPAVGRISLLGVVAVNRDNPYKMLQTASLH
jgi:putative sporulation protein YyaC